MRHGGRRAGAGRPKIPEEQRRVNLSTRIDPSAMEILKRIAKARKATLGDVIEMALIRLSEIDEGITL